MKRIIFFTVLIFSIFFTSFAYLEEFSVLFNINNIKQINSSGDEFFPSVTADEKFMIFNFRIKGKSKNNIYYSKKINNKWVKPELFTVLNSIANDETPYISPDGTVIVFSSSRKGTFLPPKSIDNVQVLTTDLYISHKIKNRWSIPVKISGDVNTIANERAPSFSSDGKYLYFSRWSLDDIDHSKIMKATYKDGKYSDVEELPAPVNLKGASDYGLIPSKNKSGFYFSSDRPGGFGLWDLYFAYYSNKNKFIVKNLGKPFNSKKNDLALNELNNNKFYFSSDRLSGKGNFDIYIVGINEKQKSKQIDIIKNIPAKIEKKIKEKSKKNIIQIGKYFFKPVYYPLRGEKIPFKAYKHLNKIVKFLKKHHEYHLVILGYSDNFGSYEQKINKSKNRAKKIYNYFIKNKIIPKRLGYKGLGWGNPAVFYDNPVKEMMNRRVEFKFIKN